MASSLDITQIVIKGSRYADSIIRFISLWLTWILLIVLFPIPLFILKLIEILSNNSIKTKAISCRVWLKRLAGYLVLVVLGIFLYIEEEEAKDDDDDPNESIESLLMKSRSIVTFSHASSLDAFIITAAVPSRSYSIAKSDLFLVPLFNLVLLTFDAIPIIREKRDKAIDALRVCSHHVDIGECIVIAPEGTRSLNGELQQFKKGPFHLYQYFEETIDNNNNNNNSSSSVTTLMIPLMIYGAFDLLPAGSMMPTPGRVVAKFLRPISRSKLTKLCDAGNDNNRDIKELERDVLANVLRKQMLEASAKVPSLIGSKLELKELIISYLTIGVVIYINCQIYDIVLQFFQGVSAINIATYSILLLLLVTIMAYVYAIHRNNINRYLNIGRKRAGYASLDHHNTIEYGSMSRKIDC